MVWQSLAPRLRLQLKSFLRPRHSLPFLALRPLSPPSSLFLSCSVHQLGWPFVSLFVSSSRQSYMVTDFHR